MVSSIGGGGSGGMVLNLFKKFDNDSSGGISPSELKTFSEDMEKKTGNTLDVGDSAFTTYDADSDETLSTAELDSLLESNKPEPPAGGGQGMGPPPPPPGRGVISVCRQLRGRSLLTYFRIAKSAGQAVIVEWK